MSYHKAIKSLLEKDSVGDGERVIGKLTDTEYEKNWNEIIELLCNVEQLKHKLKESFEVAEAKRVLFWHTVRNVSEQAESAAERGLALGVRYNEDGELVLVEFKEPENEAAGFPDFLRRLMGGGGIQGFSIGGEE